MTRSDNIPFAVCSILICVFALSLGDALIKKTVSADLPISQLFVLRSLLVVPALGAWLIVKHSVTTMRPKTLGWTIARSLLLVAMWLLYYIALPYVELSVAAAAFYTLPLFITLFSAWAGEDRVGALGWMAVALGFIGVLLILRPDTGGINVFALLPLGSAICYAIAMILTRTRCGHENPVTLALALNVVFIVVGTGALIMSGLVSEHSEIASLLFRSWIPMGYDEWIVMTLMAGAILVGSVTAALAYQSAAPSIVSTFDFAYVVFAVIWGWLFFSETPAWPTLGGIALVIAGGVIAVRR